MISQKETPNAESTTFVRSKNRIDWRTLWSRFVVLIGAAALLCLFILRPVVIRSDSMMPTYSKSEFMFAFLPYFKMYGAQRKQVVFLSRPGFNNFFLKRIIAFPGETVEIRSGVVYVNGKGLREPYVKKGCNWNLSPREVPKGKIFVLGDNRSMPMRQHVGGMINRNRLAGVPLW